MRFKNLDDAKCGDTNDDVEMHELVEGVAGGAAALSARTQLQGVKEFL